MPKLLLADDSPTTQKVVQLTFADEGIDVVVADDGDTAMELYTHHKPDIVLADINIPGLNGYEVCEAIRKRADNGSTPVILLAGSFEPFDVQKAHSVGASDYLTKPFASIRRLVATVTALLDTAARHDETAEETVEPNSVPPDAPGAVTSVDTTTAAHPESQPGPALPPEPDMYATDDIEHLIKQSFVETVEMPHTVAERMMSEIEAAKAEQELSEPATARDEAAFDDELIETTFASEPGKPAEEADQPQIENLTKQPAETSEQGEITDVTAGGSESAPAEQSETMSPELRIEPLGDEFVPPQTGSPETLATESEASAGVTTSDLSQAPTEEFQIDQSGDEAYFEPAPETAEPPSEVTDQPTAEQTGFDIVRDQVPSADHDRPPYSADQDQIIAESTQEPSAHTLVEQETVTAAEQPSVPTPWDSVAEPRPSRFSLDEANLLELPAGYGTRTNEAASVPESEVANAASELAPEIVDEIARATASHISEELVREIAQRIVPKVVEEVMARHRGENIEH